MRELSEVEILLAEDNPDDLDMALHALRKMKIANNIQISRDGVEALDFIFCRGIHSDRMIANSPNLGLYWMLLNQPPKT